MPTLTDVYAAFGRAGHTAQLIEAYLDSLLLLADLEQTVAEIESQRGSGVSFDVHTLGLAHRLLGRVNELDLPKKKRGFDWSALTLGELLRKTRELGPQVGEEEERQLDEALKARNFLMHRLFRCNLSLLETETGRASILSLLRLFVEPPLGAGRQCVARIYRARCAQTGRDPHVLLSQLLRDAAYSEDDAGMA